MRTLALPLAAVLLAAGCSGTDRAANASTSGTVSGGQAASSLAYLDAFAGQYPYDVNLWGTEPLSTRLRHLLGQQYQTFVDNMEVQAPLENDGDGILWTSGNKAHQGGLEAAMLVADTRTNALEVYLLTEHRLWHHAEREPRINLQGDARTVANQLREAAELPR